MEKFNKTFGLNNLNIMFYEKNNSIHILEYSGVNLQGYSLFTNVFRFYVVFDVVNNGEINAWTYVFFNVFYQKHRINL